MADRVARADVSLMGRGENTTLQPSRWEAAVARRSAEARATVPDLDLSVGVDVSATLALARAAGVSLTALHVRACALALREHPAANASWRDGRFERFARVNVGVVIARADAYVIPTVFDADAKPPVEIDAELRDLEARAAEGALVAPELSGATFTLSDLGRLGVAAGTPVIVPPQASAVSTGSVQDVPVLRNGAIVPGQVITVTLSSDHRVLYGAAAAAFLLSIQTRLQEASL